MNSKLLLCLALVLAGVWLVPVLCARGEEVAIRITPENMDVGGYVFSIATEPAKDGTAFYVTITSKAGIIPTNSTVRLCLVGRKPDILRIEPMDPAPRITLKNEGRVWKLDFAISRELLEKPKLSCVFRVQAYRHANGKSTPMPGADFYEIMLQDFLKQP